MIPSRGKGWTAACAFFTTWRTHPAYRVAIPGDIASLPRVEHEKQVQRSNSGPIARLGRPGDEQFSLVDLQAARLDARFFEQPLGHLVQRIVEVVHDLPMPELMIILVQIRQGENVE